MTEEQAKNVNKAYSNFVYLVLNGKQEEISCKNINNVGKKRLDLYIQKVQSDCRIILFYPVCFENGITSGEDIQKLQVLFNSPEELQSSLKENPYHIYISILGYSFYKADKLVKTYYPEFTDSKIRCEYGCLEILKENENFGDTRLNANLLAQEVKKIAPETQHHIVEAVKDSKLIHYDENTKYTSIEKTYQDELLIAENIVNRLHNPLSTPMKWEAYTTVDGFTLTDEQQEILKKMQNNSVTFLSGSAGCVDCDTEFFNGETWKKIADYQDGDYVLQYNDDGTANLVKPLSYIKEPCEALWHFSTKYGVSQTVCDEHNIIYWTKDNYKHNCKIQDIINKQQNKGWRGYFETTFNYNGKGINLTDIEIKIMCAVICDGSFYKKLPNNLTCRFHIKKDRKKEMLRALFKEYGKPYRETQSAAKGYTDFYIEVPRREKYFTPEWYNCSQHQLQVICDNIIFWDGNINYSKNGVRRLRFSANVKETADFVQFAFTACGYRASLQTKDRTGQQYFTCGKLYTRKSVEYNVSITTRHRVGICNDNRTNHKKTMPQKVPTTDGYKYCFTVPSHQLVLRRKGNIFITGNCGKSASIKAVIRMLEDNGYTYSMLCPTGTAAKVLAKATGREAYTIHMFLAKEMMCGDFLILEESSMVGVNLLADLLKSIPKSTKIIFICDPSQLPSISCGNIVHDILSSNIVPNVNLTKIFRYNSSGLITVATDTRNGKPNSFINNYSDYHFIETEQDSVMQVVKAYGEALDKGYSKNDILILTPFNKTNKGTYAINEAIQKKYNQKEFTDISIKHDNATIKFKIGDRVINKKNNYHVPILEFDEVTGQYMETAEEMFIANGSIGVIRQYYKVNNVDCLAIEFDEGVGLFSGTSISNLLLGYAVTIHASQGNQAKAVIVLFDKEHKRMLNRGLEYVAFTRSQKELWVIGDKEIIKDGMEIEETEIRDTWLGDMLEQEKNNYLN